jgi:predicted Zn-dependent protease with MMP-like domain/RimJ/RimL family protein N-acetyltransferase
MPYFPSDLPVPAGFQTRRLFLEPLRPDHGQRDFEAVMESREQLRLWSGQEWPSDDFTLAENLQDLQRHWEEHQKRIAFSYTVLDPLRQVCLGCVYMRPLDELLPANPRQLAGVAEDETLVRFWVRTSLLQGNLQGHLLRALIQWLNSQWSFSRVLFETREENSAQAAFFDAFPMQQVMSLQMADRGGRHFFYDPNGRSRPGGKETGGAIGLRNTYPRLSREIFEALVVEALADLPVYFQERLQNIEILVDSWAGPREQRSTGIKRGSLILGLYQGIPLTERTSGYQLVAPDTITLYQGAIEMVSGGDYERIRAQVKHTVIHEIAHHFGISDDRLREIGAY